MCVCIYIYMVGYGMSISFMSPPSKSRLNIVINDTMWYLLVSLFRITRHFYSILFKNSKTIYLFPGFFSIKLFIVKLSVVATGYISGLEFTRSHSFYYACLNVTKMTFDTHVTTEVGITSRSRK